MDYRKQSPQEVYAVKKTIIQQYKRGSKTSEIQKNTGMCIDIVRKTIRDYKKGGMSPMSLDETKGFLEIIVDRHQTGSTIILS